MFTVDTTEARQKRAAKKACETRPEVHAVSFGHYLVEGSEGNLYGVTVTGGKADCNCTAGRNHKPCYHAFAGLRLHGTLAAPAAPGRTQRDKRLGLVEGDLRRIASLADRMSGDYEIMEDIQRAVRAALRSLGEYEVDLLPANVDMAA